jgi:hypothetical protein
MVMFLITESNFPERLAGLNRVDASTHILRSAWDGRHPTGPLSRPSDTLSPAPSGGEGWGEGAHGLGDFSVGAFARLANANDFRATPCIF